MDDDHADASSDTALAQVLSDLAVGKRVFITFDESTHIFSKIGKPPGEWDEDQSRAIGVFAAQNGCKPNRNADAQRVYFTKARN